MTPTIIRTGNLHLRIYAKDHNPPHVHVVGPDAEAKIRLSDSRCIYSEGFSARALHRIEAFVKQHNQLLIEAWHDYQEK
jgi:hypothetical protein